MSTYENTCPKCGDITITSGWVPGGDDGYKCPFCKSDLDAAWAWYRYSGYSLKENETGTGRTYWMCYNRLTALSSETADGAVLAAWKAANKAGSAE